MASQNHVSPCKWGIGKWPMPDSLIEEVLVASGKDFRVNPDFGNHKGIIFGNWGQISDFVYRKLCLGKLTGINIALGLVKLAKDNLLKFGKDWPDYKITGNCDIGDQK